MTGNGCGAGSSRPPSDGAEPRGVPRDLHDVRKAAKRVRYAAEALVPLGGKAATRMVKAHERSRPCSATTTTPTEAQRALLGLADRAAAAGENAFTYGLLHAHLEARCAVAPRTSRRPGRTR